MATVTGLGGVFLRADDPKALRAWYAQHLGLTEAHGCTTFGWRELHDPRRVGSTVWSTFPRDTTYFAPSESEAMINYRVDDLDGLLKALAEAGHPPVGAVEETEYGRFGWVLDPENNKIELWQPPDTPASPFDANVPNPKAGEQRFFGARPTLPVADLERAIVFYREHLGFVVTVRMEGPPAFALLAHDTDELSLVVIAAPQPMPYAAVYIEVADVRALHRALTQAGLQLAHPLTTHPWGLTDFVVVDPDGHRVALGQRDA